MLYAQSATRVLLSWTHTGFSAAAQGTWAAWRVYVAGSGPTISTRARVTRSAYDRLAGIAVDRAGRSYILVNRQAPHVPEYFD